MVQIQSPVRITVRALRVSGAWSLGLELALKVRTDALRLFNVSSFLLHFPCTLLIIPCIPNSGLCLMAVTLSCVCRIKQFTP